MLRCVLLSLLLATASTLSSSKLSVHTGMGDKTWDVLKTGQPRLVKLLDNFSQSKAIKDTVPGITIVGRIFLPNQPQTGDPTQAANDWWSQNQHTILANPSVDFWEGYNEPGCGSLANMQWLSSFEAARVNILAKAGLKASIFNFGTGTPDEANQPLIQAMYPAIDAAIQNGGILGLHEYSAPNMTAAFSGSAKSGEGWLTGRCTPPVSACIRSLLSLLAVSCPHGGQTACSMNSSFSQPTGPFLLS